MKNLFLAFGVVALFAGATLMMERHAVAGSCCAVPSAAPAKGQPAAPVGAAPCCQANGAKGSGHCAVALAAEEKPAPAADAPAAKEVTLEGTIQCAKCSLKLTKQCTTAIVVKEGGKDVTYFLADKGNGESYHENVCGGSKEAGTVTGKAFEKDGKMWITPTKVAYKK